MGLFNRKKKAPPSPLSGFTPKPIHLSDYTPKPTHLTFDAALQLVDNKDFEVRRNARERMLFLAEHGQDSRAIMWVAQEYEQNGAYSAAAYWYKRAGIGIAGAIAGFSRCSNPYHVDSDFNITGERGCGTFAVKAAMDTQNKQKQDYLTAVKNLKHPSQDIVAQSLKTIKLIASAHGCAVPEAQVYVGHYCETVENDLEMAAIWFKKASDNGSADGARCYADMLISGRGVRKDEAAAIKYYSLAAERGQPEAQFVLGQYLQMSGDMDGALKYYRLAEEGGFASAKQRILEIERNSTRTAALPCEKILSDCFTTIILENDLARGDLLEYFEDIYQPDDFCKKAFDYCNAHYAGLGEEKILFEYCMTAFYGCICSVALWNADRASYASAASVWNLLYQQINVEFTDANAERLLGTKQGEDMAENIYAIICAYIPTAKLVMKSQQQEESICLLAMKFAYQLGMLVAKHELSIESNSYIREYVVRRSSSSQDPEDTADTSSELETPEDFYVYCSKIFHEEAALCGLAQRGVIFIPELIEIGGRVILAFLQDDFFTAEFSHNPTQYYYVIMSLVLQAGLCFGEKWHKDFGALKLGYPEYIIKNGPADDAIPILEKVVGLNGSNQQNAFYQKIFQKWADCHAPYWALEDARPYTFNAMMAAYQLGISIILEKYGF